MQNQIQESYCESEFDIYQEYKSNSHNESNKSNDSNDNSDEEDDHSHCKLRNLQKSKNASQLFIRNLGSNQVEMEELYKRPSLTMNGNREDNKTMSKNKAPRFKKQIETWFVNK